MPETLTLQPPWTQLVVAACQRSGGSPSAAELMVHWTARLLQAETDGSTAILLDAAERDRICAEVPPQLWWAVPSRDHAALAPDDALLVLVGTDRLQLARIYRSESALARLVAGRLQQPLERQTPGAIQVLDSLLAHYGDISVDPAAREFWQASLGGAAMQLITGGPGSGKTVRTGLWLATQALRLALTAQPLPILRLVAPTGKAAARLQQALRLQSGWCRQALQGACRDLPQAQAEAALSILDQLLATQVQTVHRALHVSRMGSPTYRASAPWAPADLLVLDEASMLSSELATDLLGAASWTHSVLWLGDSAQLPPVEAGAVLRDLVAALERPTVYRSHLKLPGVRRYQSQGVVARLAHCAERGLTASELVTCSGTSDATSDNGQERVSLDLGQPPDLAARVEAWLHARLGWLEAYRQLPAESQLARVADWRMLTPVNEGALGVAALNHLVARHFGVRSDVTAYVGCATLVTRNLPELGLANGDVGVQYATAQGWQVLFEGTEQPVSVSLRSLAGYWVPGWATTMHKAQGSEFRDVLIVLPHNLRAEAVSRELVYTAITRVRSLGFAHASLAVVATAASWDQAMHRPGQRVTGFGTLLNRALGDAVQ